MKKKRGPINTGYGKLISFFEYEMPYEKEVNLPYYNNKYREVRIYIYIYIYIYAYIPPSNGRGYVALITNKVSNHGP
jgi:hypothetical protein